jgi:hypothetical protein
VQFAPPMLLGLATIAAIIMANRMSAQRAAALAAAYGISQKNLEEYKHKLEEKLGARKAEAIRDEIQKDRVEKNPPQEIIFIGTGDVLAFDSYSGRYFMTNVEKIRKAEQAVQREILLSNEASLATFLRGARDSAGRRVQLGRLEPQPLVHRAHLDDHVAERGAVPVHRVPRPADLGVRNKILNVVSRSEAVYNALPVDCLEFFCRRYPPCRRPKRAERNDV